MSRKARAVCAVWAALAALLCGGSAGAAPGGAAQEQPLTGVLVRQGDVFAANAAGLYRALKADHRWQALPAPATMPLGGYFARQPPNARSVFYFTPFWKRRETPDAEQKVFGLYRSADDGMHWELASKEYDFRQVYLHPNGALYAIISEEFEVPKGGVAGGPVWEREGPGGHRIGMRNRILQSRDEGKNWRDITDGLGAGLDLLSILRDPDHPELVALIGNSIRSYVLQATGEDYRWTATRSWDWQATHQTEESFFYLAYGTGATLYVQWATLANYFAGDFGNQTERPAFAVEPGRPAYAFAGAGPRPVSVTVRFRQPGVKVALVDVDDSVALWGLHVVTPKGEQARLSAGAGTTPVQLRDKAQFHRHELSVDQVYTRGIDLAQIYPFTEPGTYKVQLTYDSMGVAQRDKGEWPGHFSSPVFTVTVR